jgi:hypothetical protein
MEISIPVYFAEKGKSWSGTPGMFATYFNSKRQGRVMDKTQPNRLTSERRVNQRKALVDTLLEHVGDSIVVLDGLFALGQYGR